MNIREFGIPRLKEDITPRYCGIRDAVSADPGSEGGCDVVDADRARELDRGLVVRKTFLEVCLGSCLK